MHYALMLVALLVTLNAAPASAVDSPSMESLNDVWMNYGGARMQYDALTRPIQINTNGGLWHDPANNHRLPALYNDTPEKAPAARRSRRPHRSRAARNRTPRPGTALTQPDPRCPPPPDPICPPQTGARQQSVQNAPAPTPPADTQRQAPASQSQPSAQEPDAAMQTTRPEIRQAAGSRSNTTPHTAATTTTSGTNATVSGATPNNVPVVSAGTLYEPLSPAPQ